MQNFLIALVLIWTSTASFAQRAELESAFRPEAIIENILQEFNNADPLTFGLRDATIGATLIESRSVAGGIKFLVRGRDFSIAFDVSAIRFDPRGNVVADFYIDGKPYGNSTVLIEAAEAKRETSYLEALHGTNKSDWDFSIKRQSAQDYIKRMNSFADSIQRRIAYRLDELWDLEAKEKGYLAKTDIAEVRQAFTNTAGLTLFFTAMIAIANVAIQQSSVLPQIALVSSFMLTVFTMLNPFNVRIVKAIKAALSPSIKDQVRDTLSDYLRKERATFPGGPCVLTNLP